MTGRRGRLPDLPEVSGLGSAGGGVGATRGGPCELGDLGTEHPRGGDAGVVPLPLPPTTQSSLPPPRPDARAAPPTHTELGRSGAPRPEPRPLPPPGRRWSPSPAGRGRSLREGGPAPRWVFRPPRDDSGPGGPAVWSGNRAGL